MPLHPIVRRMAPSPEQEPAILARGRDVVVTAGAGTGKTRTLVARYLSLLADGLPLRSIVAVTFTEKAAREMRNRVREQIRQYLAELTSEPPHLPGDGRGEVECWESLYQELDAARIATIHGLCAEILRAHPAEAGLDPRFDVLDEARARLLLGEAIDEALAWATEEAEPAALFTLLGERGLRDALDTLLQGRLEARNAWAVMPPTSDALIRFWQAALESRQARAWAALRARPDWADAVDTLESSAAVSGTDLMEIARQSALAALRGAAGRSLPEMLASLAGLSAIKLTGGVAKNWCGGKPECDAVKAALKTLRGLWQGNAVLALRWSKLDETLAAGMPALRRVWEFALARYEEAKRGRNAVDFDDLEAGALALLRDHAPVRERWAREVRALLVDEFQDTNARQRDLVALLNGDAGGRLFVVGDAKQSIYGFRGADVTVFRAERGRVDEAGGQVCALDTSYRAHHRLIDGLNDLLRPVLGEAADPERPWVEPFAALRHDHEDPRAGLTSPFIELLLTVGSKGEGALERAAAATASRLAEMVAGGQVDYGDVAVLCRASSSFAPYEDAFDAAGIPYLTVAGRGFYDRPEVRDLLNALRALADPTDDLALVGLLRSPAIGLSDAALYTLCRGKGSAACLWGQLQDFRSLEDFPPRKMWDGVGSLNAVLPRAAALIARLHDLVGRAPVAGVLKAFLDATCYRAALLHAGQSRAARNVGKLLADAHAGGIVGVGEFLEYVAGLRDTGAREGEARSAAEGAVQIMSVHAAKGLEFPVVVIGDAAYRRAGRTLVLPDPDLGVLLPTRMEEADDDTGAGDREAIYALGRLRADDQEEAESDRLFYVAATRAREKLILSAQVTVNRDRCVNAPGGWLGRIAGTEALGLAGFVPEGYTAEGADVCCYHLAVGDTPVACRFYEDNCLACRVEAPAGSHTGLPLPADSAANPSDRTGGPMSDPVSVGTGWPPTIPDGGPTADHAGGPLSDPVSVGTGWLPIPPGSHPGLPLLDPVAAGPEPEPGPGRRVWQVAPTGGRRATAPAWVVGLLVHAALAEWRPPDPDFERRTEARARGYGLIDRERLEDAVRETRLLLERFRTHPLFAEMDTADRRLHEQAYDLLGGAEGDGAPEHGIIDALYWRDGVWTVVDFKTDDLREEADWDRVRRQKNYDRQAARYVAAAGRLLGQPPRFKFCLLNFQGRVEVRAAGEQTAPLP